MIYKLAYELNEELLKSEIVLNVKRIEDKLNNNREFITLIMSYDALKSEIDDLEKYGLDVKEKQIELHKLKYQIDNKNEVTQMQRECQKKAHKFFYIF